MREEKEEFSMNEGLLKFVLKEDTFLIEEGLTFRKSDVLLGNGQRIDLLFEDKEGRELYVEVRLHVNDKDFGQLASYRQLVKNKDTRFMLVGVSFAEGIKETILHHKYECKEVDEEEVERRLKQGR